MKIKFLPLLFFIKTASAQDVKDILCSTLAKLIYISWWISAALAALVIVIAGIRYTSGVSLEERINAKN